jgi:hypothetical protein
VFSVGGFSVGRARRGVALKRDEWRFVRGADFGGGKMRRSLSKAMAAALVASAMTLISASPSSAFSTFHGGGMGGFHGGMGGFHGGMGGFHGGMGGFHSGFGGFHPGFGGFHPGFRPGFAGFHRGFHPFFGSRRAFFFHHHRFFPVFATGAVIGGGWWGGYDGCWTYRPVYDASGAYLGYSYVNICW